GSPGFFSAVALEKNYELLKNDFMAMEYSDARRSRAVAKTILLDDYRLANDVLGIAHRAGAVLETPGTTAMAGKPSDPAQCGAWTPASSPFCTIQEWINRERAAAPTDYTPMGANDPIQIVYVERATGSASAGRLEFDTFQGNADLKVAQTTFGA